MEKPEQRNFRQIVKVNNTLTPYILYNTIKMAGFLCDFLNSCQSNYEKNIKRISTTRYPIKHLSSTSQEFQGHQNQEKCKELSQPGEAWEYMITKYNIVLEHKKIFGKY